jgi:TRAP-type C4-dicarboxylate transport system permease small subunit
MKAAYRSAMEALYVICMTIAGVSLVVMTLAVPYGVFMRYVMNSAASWPEPLAVLMMIVFTFLGGAACLRANIHIAVRLFIDSLPDTLHIWTERLVTALLSLLCLFMIFYGFRLVETTWYQVMAEFTFLRVGIAYLPIPVSGILTILFIIERVWLGEPPRSSVMHREPVSAD